MPFLNDGRRNSRTGSCDAVAQRSRAGDPRLAARTEHQGRAGYVPTRSFLSSQSSRPSFLISSRPRLPTHVASEEDRKRLAGVHLIALGARREPAPGRAGTNAAASTESQFLGSVATAAHDLLGSHLRVQLTRYRVRNLVLFLQVALAEGHIDVTLAAVQATDADQGEIGLYHGTSGVLGSTG
jgi:hypothetical protein